VRLFLVSFFIVVVDVRFSGPEPLDAEFTDDVLKERLSQATKKKIKPLLLDQSFIAGIGNIYADEALWHARINPERIASTLKDDEVSRLRTGIREVLELGIARNGASVSTFQQPNGEKGQMQEALEAYGRTGLLCSRCKKSKIKKIVLAQRGTHFCPRCQK
jgi:formamidopyrimidine-DNA glycosylase